ncbi:MAG: hypothetical protein NZ555_17375 [Geminicoccaceae bacterium]|nr:hypothetical protein [Geminicoccaceae bacterium]
MSLDPRFEGLVYPSKVYGIRAAGRPLVWLRPGLGVEELRRAAGASPVDLSPGRSREWLAVIGGLEVVTFQASAAREAGPSPQGVGSR